MRRFPTLVALSSLALLLAASRVETTPAIAARYAQNCDTACHQYIGSLPQFAPQTACSLSCMGCHVSPSGGGLRNDSGYKVGKNNLHLKSHLVPEEEVEEISPMLNEHVRYGLDFRFLYRNIELDDDLQVDDSFRDGYFLMQASAYLSVEPFRHTSLVFMHDFKNEFGQYFALYDGLPLNGYIMAGRFDIPYGLRVADHTSFVRTRLGFGVRSQDDGIQIGFQPGRPYVALAYTNGSLDPVPALGPKGKAFTAKAGYWHEYFSLGGNFYRNEEGDVSIYGGQGTATVWKFTYLTELDWFERGEIDGVASLHQLNFFPVNWLNFRLQYDFFDPDTNIKDDAEHRYSVGALAWPMPFTELEVAYRIYDETPDIDNNELIFILHGYF